MDQPTITRPNCSSGNLASELSRYEADAYRERTFEEGKRSQADRLSQTRMEAVELAFKVYKDDVQVFGLDDVLKLADRIVAYVRDGQSIQDGAKNLRFYGRK